MCATAGRRRNVPWHGGTHGYVLTVERSPRPGSPNLSPRGLARRQGHSRQRLWVPRPHRRGSLREDRLLDDASLDGSPSSWNCRARRQVFPRNRASPSHLAVYDALVASGYPETQYFFVYYYNAQWERRHDGGHPRLVRSQGPGLPRIPVVESRSRPLRRRLPLRPSLFDNAVGEISATACYEYLWLP